MESKAYRKLIECAAADEPTAAEVARLEARLAPQLGALPASTSPFPWRPVSIGIAIVPLAALVFFLTRSPSSPPPATAGPASVALSAPEEPTPAEPAREALVPAPAPTPESDESPAPRTSLARTAAPQDELAEEVRLLRAAEGSLASNPSEALRLGEEHRRRFPRGTLAQEREVFVIDALVRLGRAEAARGRAVRFHARYAGSSHADRVDALVGAQP